MKSREGLFLVIAWPLVFTSLALWYFETISILASGSMAWFELTNVLVYNSQRS